MDDDPRILSDLFIVLYLIAGEKTPSRFLFEDGAKSLGFG
jgi:hypothetical protein